MKKNRKQRGSISLWLWLLLFIAVGGTPALLAKNKVNKAIEEVVVVTKEALKKAKPASGKPEEVKAPPKTEEEKKQEAAAKQAEEGDDVPQQEDGDDDSSDWKPEAPAADRKAGTWTLVDSGELKFSKVSVGDADTVFGIADNKVYVLGKGGWKEDKMPAVLVAAAYDDTTFAINEKNEVFQRKGAEKWEPLKELKLSHIAAASKANIWAVGVEKGAFQIKEGKAVAVNNALSKPAKGMEMFAPVADGRVLGSDGKTMSLRTLERMKVIEETKSLRKGLKGRWQKQLKKIQKQIKQLQNKKKIAKKDKKKKFGRKDKMRLRQLKRKRNKLKKRVSGKKGKSKKKKNKGKKGKKNKKKKGKKKNKKKKNKGKKGKKKKGKKKNKKKAPEEAGKDGKGAEAKEA